MYTWQNGEVITAEKLNTLEGRIGFDVVEDPVVIEEEVTTKLESTTYAYANLQYSDFIDTNVLNVIFDGVEYTLEKKNYPVSAYLYGDKDNETNVPVFDNYPLAIISFPNRINSLFTKDPGTHNIKINFTSEIIETTSGFEQAVKKFGLKNIKDGEGGRAIIEGSDTKASGSFSHAEGFNSTASGYSSHAEGASTTASGDTSHAEGAGTTASGYYSHAEGESTTVSGYYSHAQNRDTIAQGRSQTAIGEYNVAQGTETSRLNTDYAFIIGNGNSDDDRSNALAIKWDGTFVFANGTEISPVQFASLKALLNT